MQVRIRRFFRFYWERKMMMTSASSGAEKEIVASLSTPLRQEVLHCMFASTITQARWLLIALDCVLAALHACVDEHAGDKA